MSPQQTATQAKAKGSTEAPARLELASPPQDESPVAKKRREMDQESSDLLTLAMALKAEVDKTNKDTLSLAVIRKADEIEQLARTMRKNLKQ